MEENIEQETQCAFQWDEDSQLYYHASSGFYHDPQAGWYYSTKDGLYYKFEDGNYVLLDSSQAGDQTDTNNTNLQGEKTFEAQMEEVEASVEPSLDSSACNTSGQSDFPPPPSEWLEDTLIEMYLSGYSNPIENHGTDEPNGQCGDDDDDENEELEEGEWVPDDPGFWKNFSEKILAEGVTEEEEDWRAQYGGQVVRKVNEEWMLDLKMVDLWDWGLVKGTKKDGKTEVARLVGRQTDRSTKLHPSVPSGGRILKTAPVCEVHHDIVRVTSGRLYRLRTPSSKYLASLPFYDASYPTKDWGFPQLSVKSHIEKLSEQPESQNLEAIGVYKDKPLSSVKLGLSKKDHNIYRDRAAERRALHGGFGVGPGQKNSFNGSDFVPSSPTSPPEEAAAEALNISFGVGSYARKLLEGMGWKEGEALGSSMKGLIEPLQASGNKGTAGLGFADGWKK
ncbi:hypothetical protein CASFOL_013143 [Castilleja foliolosa]|uniref:G-patch domain-containing protein n=1 Tax=Castilleja foliolosa TaxID=1961234 RepID=A0ABD3DJ67_9LAMI